MSVFGSDYAAVYDLLYGQKDYAAEVAAIGHLAEEHVPGGRRVVDFGCGTGSHAALLCAAGFAVTGVDRSPAMLGIAREKLAGTSAQLLDVEAFDRQLAGPPAAAASFDLWLTLFDVFSYLTEYEEPLALLARARRALRDGGLLLFDFWYAPGVLSLRPERRWRECSGDGRRLLRLTEPRLDLVRATVEVDHTLLVFDERSGAQLSRCEERHAMRIFGDHEIRLLLAASGFELVRLTRWAALDERPTERDWSALAVARALPPA